MQRGVKRLSRCPTLTTPTHAIDWHAVAFGIPIHHSKTQEELLTNAASTWLRLVSGADVLLSTDRDDARTDDDIGHLLAAAAPSVLSHVFRCPICCSGGPTAPGRKHLEQLANTTTSDKCLNGVREGWQARSKVLHMLAAMHQRSWRSTKLYFMKVDADTLVHPHHLLPLLVSLGPLAATDEPLIFGQPACRSPQLLDLCHAAGGGGYVVSKPAVAAISTFVRTRLDAKWLRMLDNNTYGGEDVAVALALKQMTGASVISVGGFHQTSPDQIKYYRVDAIQWPAVRPLTFHFRFFSALLNLFRCTFYETMSGRNTLPVEKWRPRCFTPSADLYLATWHCPKFIPDLPSAECIEMPPNKTVVNQNSLLVDAMRAQHLGELISRGDATAIWAKRKAEQAAEAARRIEAFKRMKMWPDGDPSVNGSTTRYKGWKPAG